MDNTEIHYISYDPDTIWLKMLDAYDAAGGDVLYSGDEKEILLRAVQQMMVQGFAEVDNALRMATRRYAVRDYLDVYGESNFCDRIQSTAATAKVEITFKAGAEAGTIPAGAALTQDGVIVYQLSEDVSPGGTAAQTIQADIVCRTPGNAGNGLAAGAQMQFLSQQSRVESVVCVEGATGGTDTEEDEAYRERIGSSRSSFVAGTEPYYEALAMSTSALIVDAKAIKSADGVVTVYLLLEDGLTETGKTAVISTTRTALSDQSARALTDSMIVNEAEALSYTLNVSCTIPTSVNSAALTAAAAEYQEWQERKIGRPFNPDKLMAMLYQAGAERATWQEGTEFDGGNAVFTEIEQGQYCKGSVTITVSTT